MSIDDQVYITENPHVVSGLTWSGVKWAFTSGEACNWHPLTWLSHMLDCQLYGLNPSGHHLTSLLLHLANALLLFLFLKQATGAVWRSALVAALFAWHPLHVESVAWVAERKDVLSTFFFLITLMAYVRFAMARAGRERQPGTALEHSHPAFCALPWHPYSLALLFFALGLMSKPMLVTLPFILLLLDFWPIQRLTNARPTSLSPPSLDVRAARFPILRLALEKLPFLALSLVSCAVTYFVQKAGGAVSSLTILPLHARMANALVAYVGYISKAIWPSHLAVMYPYSEHISVFVVIAAAGILAAVSGGCLWFARSRPYLAVGWFWFVGTLVPVIGLVQVGSQSMADRYMYIPSIGLFIMVVWGVAELSEGRRRSAIISTESRLVPSLCASERWKLSQANDEVRPTLSLGTAPPLSIPTEKVRCERNRSYYRKRNSCSRFCLDLIAPSLAATALIGCLAATSAQLRFWRNGETLFRHALAVTSNNYIAFDGLGGVLSRLGRLQGAQAMCAEAVHLAPSYAQGQYDFGTILLKEGRFDEAVEHLSEAVALQPSFADARINLGKALLQLGMVRRAQEQFAAATTLLPDDPEAQYNFGTVLLNEGQLAEAVVHLSRAVQMKPDYAEAHGNLGVALMSLGNWREGLRHFAEQVRLRPSDVDAYINLGVAELQAKRFDEAASTLAQAARLAPDLPKAQFYLALALAREAKSKDAVEFAQRAQKLAVASGQEAMATKAQSLLDLCRSGAPIPTSF